MFGSKGGGLTDFSGKANNCVYVARNKLANEDCMRLLVPGEEAMFLLKSRKDEFLFTDQGLIFIDGESVASPKRTITRTNYFESKFYNIILITPGVMDNDFSIEFKFDKSWRLEMAKEELENGKIVVRCLEFLSMMQSRNRQRLEQMNNARSNNARIDVSGSGADAIAALSLDATVWANTMVDSFMPMSYKSAFEAVLGPLEK